MGRNKKLWSAALVVVGGLVALAATSLPVGEPEYMAVVVNRATTGSQSDDYAESERVTAALNSLAQQDLKPFSITALNEDRVLIIARRLR